MGVQARTLELYRQVGLADALVEGGIKVLAGNFWVGGKKVARVPLGDIGEGLTPFPYLLSFPQDAHERVLIERLEALGVTVERRTELVRFDERADGVCATIRRADGAEEICDATYLAGCDGARSTVREALAVGFPGGTYAHVFYVADIDASGPAANGEINIDLERDDFLAIFPLKPTGRLRLVGAVRDDQAHEHGQLTFDDVSHRVIENMKFTIAKVNWFSTYHVHHRVAARFRVGRAFLLGDAAHIHSPVGGQGMNTGIGDAVNLAWKLAAVLSGGADDSLLETYEPERIGFAASWSRRPIACLASSRSREPPRSSHAPGWPLPQSPCCSGCVRCAGSCSTRFRRSGSIIAAAHLPKERPEPSAAAIACPGFRRGRTRITSPRSPRWHGKFMFTGQRATAWRRPAPSSGCRSTRSIGRRRWPAPVWSAGHFIWCAPMATSHWPIQPLILSAYGAIFPTAACRPSRASPVE